MRTVMGLCISPFRRSATGRRWAERSWLALARSRIIAIALLLLATLGLPVLAATSAPVGEQVSGLFRVTAADGSSVPVSGVKVSLTKVDGTLVEQVVSGLDGRYQVAVPGPGTYGLAIDLGTLPAGIILRSGRPDRLTVNVLEGQQMVVLFPLAGKVEASAQALQTDNESATRSSLISVIAQLAFDGLVFGMILAVAAAGWSLIYRVSGVVNFAHGEMLSLSAVLAFGLSAADSGPHLPLVLAAVIAAAAVAALGGALEVGLFRRLAAKAQEHFAILVFTIGLSFMLRYFLLYLFGANSHPYHEYALQEQIHIGYIAAAPRDLWIVGLSSVVLMVLGITVQCTRFGQAMRAVADNRSLAAASGIDVKRIVRNVWIMGSGLAAIAGVFWAISQQVRWDLGFLMLMFIFAAAILGGIGTVFGTIAGGIIVGVTLQLGTLIFPAELKTAVAMLLLTVVLLFRPQGIFNRAQRVG